jgi:CBS domain containing-hemolysin-like protein
MTGWALLVAVALLGANAFYVALEFALVASRSTKVEPLAESGNRRAKVALRSMKELNLQLAGAQLGITMASLGLGFVAEPAVARVLEDAIGRFVELPSGVLHTISFVVALSIVVFLHMVLGEMVPKNVAIAGPERTLLWLAVPNRVYVTVFRPFIWMLNGLANLGVRALGVEPADELAQARTPDELTAMIAESREEGLLEEFEHSLLRGALHFGARDARTVMVDRDRLVTVPKWATVGELARVVVASGHSRIPVTDGGLDDIVGFVHAKDLLTTDTEDPGRRLPLPLVRQMLVVPPERSLDALLLAMRQARVHMALVREGARTLGMVTLEDLLEELVGDIRDETDRDDRVGPVSPGDPA